MVVSSKSNQYLTDFDYWAILIILLIILVVTVITEEKQLQISL